MSTAIPITPLLRDPGLKKALTERFARASELALVDGETQAPMGLVVMELSGEETERSLDFERIARLMDDARVEEVFILSQEMDPDVLLTAMRMGVKEVLFLPLSDGELEKALSRFVLRRERGASGSARRGRVLDVFGAKGGVGTTSVAVNLAMELSSLAATAGRSVALVDMNVPFGEVPLFLDLDPLYHWGEAVSNVDRLDATFMMSIMTRHPSGLYVLPAPGTIDGADGLTPEALTRLFELLTEMFDFVVVDGGGYLDELSMKVMEFATRTLVVSELSLPCLANLKRLREVLGHDTSTSDDEFEREERIPSDRFKLVFNRFLSNSEISVEDAESIIGQKAFWLIPNDYATAVSAINQGKAMAQIAAKAPVTKSMGRMATMLAENRAGQTGEKQEEKRARRSIFGLAFNLFRRAEPEPVAAVSGRQQ